MTDELRCSRSDFISALGEQRDGDQQGDRHDDRLRVVEDVGRVDAEGGHQQQARHDADADGDRAAVEARRQRDERDDQPRERPGSWGRRSGRSSRRSRARRAATRRRSSSSGWLRGGELAVDELEADDGDRERDSVHQPTQWPQASSATASTTNGRARAVRLQPLLHVDGADAVRGLGAQPRAGRDADVRVLAPLPLVGRGRHAT